MRLYPEKLKFWHRITDVAANDRAALVVGHIKGDAYEYAVDIRIPRKQALNDGHGNIAPTVVELTGDDAICEPAANAVHDAARNVLLEAQHSGLRIAIEVLKDEYVLEEQDEANISLEDIFNFQGHTI